MVASREVIYAVVNESPVRDDLFEILCANDYSVVSFASTREYLEFRREDSCACLITGCRTSATASEVYKLISSSLIPVIFITSRGDTVSALSAVKAGAVAVLTKPIAEAALLASVEKSFDVDRANRNEATELGALLDRYESLTPREREILPLLTNGLLNKQAAFELGITEYTVQIHRGHIMRKMEADSFATLVKIATKLKLEPAELEESKRNG